MKQIGMETFPKPGDVALTAYASTVCRDAQIVRIIRPITNELTVENDYFWIERQKSVLAIATVWVKHPPVINGRQSERDDDVVPMTFIYDYASKKFGWISTWWLSVPVCECGDCSVVL